MTVSSSDNSVWFIDAFVDGLDLAVAGFGRVAAKVTGRPAYAPADLPKLYIYGYLTGRGRAGRWRPKPPQHRSDLAAASPQAGLQDDR